MLEADADCEKFYLDELSDNHKLRFLAGNQFDCTAALASLKQGEQWLIDENMQVRNDKILERVLPKAKMAILGRDKQGRPNVLWRCAEFNPGSVNN